MAGGVPTIQPRSRPALATTYEGASAALLRAVTPLIDYLEVAPDSIAATTQDGTARLRPEAMDEIASVTPALKLIVHGIGLSIGSFDGWNEQYLKLLDEFFARFTPLWHSEHLGYTTVAGEDLGTMLALPRTDEMLDLVCERVTRIQERYGIPFLIEHIIQILPDQRAPYTPAGFLNELVGRTGCGLIIDAYNLECDRHNYGLDVNAFLDELNLSAVRELHLAGGTQVDGFQLDIHSNPTAEATLELGLDVIARSPNLRVVTYEFLKEALPVLGVEGVCQELRRLRKAIEQ